MVEPVGICGDRGSGGEEEFLLMEISNNGEHSWQLNFEGFQLSTEHKEKPPRGLQDCLGVLDSSSTLDQKIVAALRLIVPREKRGVPTVAKHMQKLSMISPNGEGLDRCNWITANSGIQQLQIHFEEQVSSDVDQAICIRTSMEDEKSAFEYVEVVLLASRFRFELG